MRTHSLAVTTCALALWASAGAAHKPDYQAEGPALLHVQDHQEHGSYLVDDHGMSLYLFEADVQGGDGQKAQSTCYDRCAVAWPPLLTEGEPEADDKLDPELIGIMQRDDGTIQVTYHGWPLYYFSADYDAGHTRGHDIEANGAEWYLVTPEGEKAGEEQ